jgi:hypothetical protein
VVEWCQNATQQGGEKVGVVRSEASQDAPFVGQEVDQGRVHLGCPCVGELHHDAAAIVERWMALNEPASSEPVDSVGHGSGGDESLLQQPPWSEAIGITRSTQCRKHIELPALETVTAEGLATRPVEVPSEPRHPTEHLKWRNV